MEGHTLRKVPELTQKLDPCPLLGVLRSPAADAGYSLAHVRLLLWVTPTAVPISCLEHDQVAHLRALTKTLVYLVSTGAQSP